MTDRWADIETQLEILAGIIDASDEQRVIEFGSKYRTLADIAVSNIRIQIAALRRVK